MAFNFGCDEKLLSSSEHSDVKRWPTEGEKVGLFDADTVPYIVGYTSTEHEYLQFKRAKHPFETDVWKSKISHASYIINSTLAAAGCDAAMFYLTDSFKNFRLNIGTLKEYKGQRRVEKPPFFRELKDWIRAYHHAKRSNLCEADDEISMEAWRRHLAFAKEHGDDMLFTPTHRRFSGFCILSQDKDLNIIPGLHNSVGKDCDPLNEIWVDRIGWLEPEYKEVEVNDYEFWPLFNGKEVNPKNLFSMKISEHGISPAPYHQLKEEETGWEKKHIWYSLDIHGIAREQDTVTRGARKGEGKYKRLKVGRKVKQNIDKLKGAGLLFFYAQIITGDAVDNYPGLPGYGPKKAFDILDGAKDEFSMYQRVLAAYREYYRKSEKALTMLTEQGQLAWMQTKKFELWQPPTKEKGSFPL
jgi:hypothetical protein